MRKTLEVIHGVLDKLMVLIHWVAGLLTGVFLMLTFVQVVLRYFFNSPIYGVDEYVIALMVWANALGFVVVYWHNEHAMIEFLISRVPAALKYVLYWITNLVVLAVSAVFIPAGYHLFTLQVVTTPRMGLPFPKAYYLALPMLVMGVLVVLLCSFRTIEYAVTRKDALMNSAPQEGVIQLD